MSNFVITRNTQSYREAVQATYSIEPPAIGFAEPSDLQGTLPGNTVVIKQKNMQLQLLIQVAETLKNIQADLKTIVEQTRGSRSSTAAIPDSLVEKLQKLTLGAQEKQREGKGKLGVFKDPFKILQEEKEKLKN
ncbi:hypothetical protein ZIOFF_019068 [Zingiber officinale]|uniref:Uncharacterized protein n=1 Tax=Zingiber officinale TaxID=94328 RepID=A0A8J5H713_ZINOF|nr:hypothetical protein ZIOFF_019068 [Zingiber officinale]